MQSGEVLDKARQLKTNDDIVTERENSQPTDDALEQWD
jgi:hypothetical protein